MSPPCEVLSQDVIYTAISFAEETDRSALLFQTVHVFGQEFFEEEYP